MSTRQAEVEQRFERELARDQQLRLMFSIGSWAVTLSTFAMFFVLTIGLGRTSPWLLALTLYSIGTSVLSLAWWKAFLYPRFLAHLGDPDPSVAAAAAAVLERHRPAVVRRILISLMRDADASGIAALDAAELGSLARQYDIERHRRIGRRWLIAWCVLSLVIWGTVIGTGGGPSN